MSLIAEWGLLEWSIVLGFGVPIAVLCIAFAVLACMISTYEKEGNSTW